VAGALPKAIRSLPLELTDNREVDIRLCIPYYSCINSNDLRIFRCSIHSYKNEGKEDGIIFCTLTGNIPIYLISGKPISKSREVYSRNTSEDGEKFTFFSLAILEMIKKLDWKPDIIHANDWHTALTIHALQHNKDQSLQKIHTIITLHNLPFMGAGTLRALQEYQVVPSQDMTLPEWARTLPLPMGLSAADRIIAVSPHYAREIMRPAFGCNLQRFLKTHGDKVSGILNGLDTSVWDPETIDLFPINFQQIRLCKSI